MDLGESRGFQTDDAPGPHEGSNGVGGQVVSNVQRNDLKPNQPWHSGSGGRAGQRDAESTRYPPMLDELVDDAGAEVRRVWFHTRLIETDVADLESESMVSMLGVSGPEPRRGERHVQDE